MRTNYPLKNVMSKPETVGRMSKWAMRLSTYNLDYEPRTTIKSQALADFVADFSPTLEVQAVREMSNLETPETIKPIDVGSCTLHIDGAANVRGTGLGIVLESLQGDKIVLSISCEFKATTMRLSMKP